MIAFDFIRRLFTRKPRTIEIRYREPVQKIVDAINAGSMTINVIEHEYERKVNPVTIITLTGKVLGLGKVQMERELNWFGTGIDDNAEIFLYRSNAGWMIPNDTRVIFHAAQRYFESEVH